MKKMKVPLSVIKMAPTLQMRTNRLDTVEGYAELMKEGVPFTPISVVYDPKARAHWLFDGKHRVRAAEEAGLNLLVANVYEGTKRDAERMALGCNENGLNRDKATKLAVVERIEADDDWKTLDDAEKAKLSSMSVQNYRRLRKEIQDTLSTESAQCAVSPQKDSTIPEQEDENEPDVELLHTSSGKVEEKAIVRDATGRIVPDSVREIFLKKQDIKDFINRIDKLKSDTKEAIKANPTLWSYFRTNPFETELANVRRQFRFAVPHVLCPYCSGVDSDSCKLCRGAGFLNEETYRAVPVELK